MDQKIFSKEGDTLQIIRNFLDHQQSKLAENLLKQIFINVFDRNIIKIKQHVVFASPIV